MKSPGERTGGESMLVPPTIEIPVTPELEQQAIEIFDRAWRRIKEADAYVREHVSRVVGIGPTQMLRAVSIKTDSEPFGAVHHFSSNTGIDEGRRVESLTVGSYGGANMKADRENLLETLQDQLSDEQHQFLAQFLASKYPDGHQDGYLTGSRDTTVFSFGEDDSGETQLKVNRHILVQAWNATRSAFGDNTVELPMPLDEAQLKSFQDSLASGERDNIMSGDSFPTYGFKSFCDYYTFRTVAARRAAEDNLELARQAIVNREPLPGPVAKQEFYEWESEPLMRLVGKVAIKRADYLLQFAHEDKTPDNPLAEVANDVFGVVRSSTYRPELAHELMDARDHAEELVQQRILNHYLDKLISEHDSDEVRGAVSMISDFLSSQHPQVVATAAEIVSSFLEGKRTRLDTLGLQGISPENAEAALQDLIMQCKEAIKDEGVRKGWQLFDKFTLSFFTLSDIADSAYRAPAQEALEFLEICVRAEDEASMRELSGNESIKAQEKVTWQSHHAGKALYGISGKHDPESLARAKKAIEVSETKEQAVYDRGLIRTKFEPHSMWF